MWIYGLSPNIIFNKNPNQNALEYLAFGKDFIMDRLRLEMNWTPKVGHNQQEYEV